MHQIQSTLAIAADFKHLMSPFERSAPPTLADRVAGIALLILFIPLTVGILPGLYLYWAHRKIIQEKSSLSLSAISESGVSFELPPAVTSDILKHADLKTRISLATATHEEASFPEVKLPEGWTLPHFVNILKDTIKADIELYDSNHRSHIHKILNGPVNFETINSLKQWRKKFDHFISFTLLARTLKREGNFSFAPFFDSHSFKSMNRLISENETMLNACKKEKDSIKHLDFEGSLKPRFYLPSYLKEMDSLEAVFLDFSDTPALASSHVVAQWGEREIFIGTQVDYTRKLDLDKLNSSLKTPNPFWQEPWQ